jgi:hypothetical protein
VGPEVIGLIKDRWGSYAGGLDVVGAMMALSAVLVLAMGRRMAGTKGPRDYGTVCRRDRRRRAKFA